jgi:hypothetical protein
MNANPELFAEIYEVIERYLNSQGNAPSDWVTQDIVNRHNKIEGPDADFCLERMFDNIREEVRRAIRRYDITPEAGEPDPQLTMEGFERLQKVYSVMRGGRSVAVRVELMSDVELQAKENELEKFAGGSIEHRNEIRRYRLQRRGAAE